MVLSLFTRRKKNKKPKTAAPAPSEGNSPIQLGKNAPSTSASSQFVPADQHPLDPDPLKRMLQQKRFCSILSDMDKWQGHEQRDEIAAQASSAIERATAIVPEGTVAISQSLIAYPGADEDEHCVQPYLIDVYAVTNERFQFFVDADGYDDLQWWPEDIWPHLIEFKDSTGKPGPRFWRDGRHDARLTQHPVTGISWFEARAFALWIGQRLVTEAEWQMASSWHINSSADILRRFPWGDALDNQKCNIWSSGHGTTVPVDEYVSGAAPNQVLQLIGNTWEWISDEFRACDDQGRQIVAEMPMHVIRGGAFDTYFEPQATSQFRTGQISMARSHNTGFRCAMDLDRAFRLDEE